MARIFATWLLVSAGALAPLSAPAGEPGAPVYQRRSSVWHDGWHRGGQHHRYHHPAAHQASPNPHAPTHHQQPTTNHHQPTTYQQHSGFSFQRPYPYHLDYYRMKYGGGYDPYFGNLYGPPKVYAPTNISGQPYGPHGYGGYPPPGDYYGPPPYGGVAPGYDQPLVVESVPAESPPPAAPATVDPEPAAQ